MRGVIAPTRKATADSVAPVKNARRSISTYDHSDESGSVFGCEPVGGSVNSSGFANLKLITATMAKAAVWDDCRNLMR